MVALDGNLTVALLSEIAHSPLFARADLRVAPASPGKAERLLPLLHHPRATLYVNLEEASLIGKANYADAPEGRSGLGDVKVKKFLIAVLNEPVLAEQHACR